MEENTRENKMGTMPIGKLLANMAGPVMISMPVSYTHLRFSCVSSVCFITLW